MKKILLLLVGAIVALAANAQLYLCGVEFGEWNPKNATKVELKNGYYHFSATETFKMSTTTGAESSGNGWDEFNGGGMSFNGDWKAAGDYQKIDLKSGAADLSPLSGYTYYRVHNDFKYMEASTKQFPTDTGGEVAPSYNYAVKGDFGDLPSNWGSFNFDSDLTATYDFGTGKKGGNFGIQQLKNGNQEGWFYAPSGSDFRYDATNSGKTFSLVKENGSNGGNLSLSDASSKLYGIVTFKLTIDAAGNPTALTITGGTGSDVDVYSFSLYNGDSKVGDFTGSNPYAFTYNISTPLSADTPLCVKRAKNGTVDKTYNLESALTYDGTNGGEKTLKEVGNDLVLAATLEGAVAFTLNVTDNVPVSISVSGGQLHQETFKEFWLIGKFNGWSQKGDDYKFSTTDGKTYTYVAKNEIKSEPGGEGDAGWKINEGTWDDGYVVFGKVEGTAIEYNQVFNLTTDRNAKNLEKDIPAGAKMTLTYNPGGTSTLLISTEEDPLPEVEPAPTTLYIQMKYDYSNQAKDAPQKETDPILNPMRCHIYNSSTGKSKHDFGSDEEIMTRESFRYSLWKYDMSEQDVKTYDAVDFYFYTNKDASGKYTDPIQYHSHKSTFYVNGVEDARTVAWHDKANWTRFIYATATLAGHKQNDDNPGRYACQSMISYSDFKALNDRDAANGGRSNLYLVGWGVKFDAEDADGNLIESGKSLPGVPAESYALPADNGCFYLPVYKPGSDDDGKFKVSFVNTGEASRQMARFGSAAKTLADTYDEGIKGRPRHWATFDLGLVGVDTRFDYTQFPNSWQPTYANGSAGSPGSVNMVVNRSVKYNNVNQGDWIVPKDTPKDKNYFVFDSHSECMSVSLIDFNPHPQVTTNSCDVNIATLENSEAVQLHNHDNHLTAWEANGHIFINNINYAHANITIKAADGNHLSDDGRYSSAYSLLLDGRELNEDNNAVAGTYNIEFIPVSKDCNLQVRGKYTNNINHLTFHSRTRRADLSTDVKVVDPQAVAVAGRYVYNKDLSTEGSQVYGVFVDEIPFGFDENADIVRHYYPDYDIAGAEIVDSKHYVTGLGLSSGLAGWVKNPEADGMDWFENGENNDWSSTIKTTSKMPLFIPNVVTVASKDELADNVITGKILAMYPFMVDPEAKLVPVTANAPARNAGRAAVTVEGKKLSYVPGEAEVTISVPKDNPVSGVANVAVDTDTDAEVEYFTISGMRVMGDPAPGIYLRRQGDKVSKVVIR